MSKRLTKKEIVKTISEEIGLTQLKTKEIVQRTFDAIIEALVNDPDFENKKGIVNRIELRNFGVFEVKRRAARTARNPKTGDPVDVPEKFVVTFKPGKEMEEKVRELQVLSRIRQDSPIEKAGNEDATPRNPVPPVSSPGIPGMPPIGRTEHDQTPRENTGS